jgi:hypothetical protein
MCFACEIGHYSPVVVHQNVLGGIVAACILLSVFSLSFAIFNFVMSNFFLIFFFIKLVNLEEKNAYSFLKVFSYPLLEVD